MLFLQTPKNNIDQGEAEVDVTFWGSAKTTYRPQTKVNNCFII